MDEPERTNVSNTTPTLPSATHDNVQDENGAAEPAPSKPKRHRGRQAKDPLGQTVQFKCNKVEDLEQQLRDYLANPTGDPAHTTLEFLFPVTAAFLIALREPKGNKPLHDKTPYTYSHFNKTAVTVIDALQSIQDPKEQMLTQKGISKTLVDAVQEADGYHYSFHNHWISREDQASRFSYFCNDSVLNKGRAANEGLAKVKAGVKVRKQVWECEGMLAIKFSLTKMCLELHYKHIPLHPTFDERAPLPRSGSKRRKLMEIFHPEKLQSLKRGRPKRKASSTSQAPGRRSRRHEKDSQEPMPRLANEPAAAIERDNSLQPLFDFLGSGEQAAPAPAGWVGDQVEHEAVYPTILPQVDSNNGAGVATTSEEVAEASGSRPLLAGTMTGFLSGEQISWGRRTRDSNKTKSKRTAPIGTNPARATSTSAGSTIDPTTELEALKAKLREAEQKIQYLEAERNHAAAPLTWTRSSHLPSTPSDDSAPPQSSRSDLYPQQYPHTLPPQWQSQHDSSSSAPSRSDSLHRSLPPQNPESGSPSYPHSPIRTLPENIPYYGFVPVVRNPKNPPPTRKLQPKPLAIQLQIQRGSSPHFHVATQSSIAGQSRSGPRPQNDDQHEIAGQQQTVSSLHASTHSDLDSELHPEQEPASQNDGVGQPGSHVQGQRQMTIS
ncbi:hypothetical protein RBB50_001563 [Rhinocladiella similis]